MIPDRWLFPYDRRFSAVDWLAAHSPRAWDTPDFGKWITDAAKVNNLNAQWLLMTAEKEQSFLTRKAGGPGWERAVKWTMGYGATDGGDVLRYAGTRTQVFAAARGLRGYLTPGTPYYVGGMVGKPFTDLKGEVYTPTTLAEACQLRYTPHVKYLPDLRRVWESLFGKEAEVMAHGYETLHPIHAAALKQCGVPDWAITQTYGYATASAGYHSPEGKCNGLPFSSCLDLSMKAVTPDLLNRLVQAGIAPFVRTSETGWSGSAHCHCVGIGLTSDGGKVTILPGPRSQLKDWCAGYNGLAHRAPQPRWQGWLQTVAQRQDLAAHYSAWVPDYATGVYRGGDRLPCYAWFESPQNTVRCDVRMLVEALGGRVTWNAAAGRAQAYDDHGNALKLPSGKVEVDYYRANIREVAEAFGFDLRFEMINGGTACRVHLSR
jgi:hypothetical protein